MSDADFVYTNKFGTSFSTALDDVYYNRNSKELLVVLNSGYGYVYDDVPYSVYENFRNALSKGRFYAKEVKPKFGPGTALGYDPFVEKLTYEAPSMDAVTVSADDIRAHQGITATTGPVLVDLNPVSAVAEPERVEYDHVVHFTVEGGNNVKTHTVRAGSNVHEAVDKFAEAVEALGIDVNVKGVFISFE